MPTIRFYLFKDSADASKRLQFACHLCARAVAEKLKVWILCADAQMAQTLDDMLWQHPAEAFIPHYQTHNPPVEIPPEQLTANSYVYLSIAPERAAQTDILINLSNEAIPDIPRNCHRVFEIVTQQPSVLTTTRQRYVNYRERGLNPEITNV